MKYRPEIDGLRALAIVSVILFHAGFEFFSGGFIGVDVFFVISGYLITTILIEDIEKKRFSLVNFYERRARRIFPALFFVMLVCIPFAWMWMLPNQLKDFSQSLVAVSLFASNILFWQEGAYHTVDAIKPLLHTWSLGVEEQYYLLFPIILFLAWRYGKNRVFWTIVVLTVVSLTLSEWGWRYKAVANFYFAPTRFWELFSGSIAAFIVLKRGVQSNNLFSLMGLGAIVFSIFAYDETTPFPSVYALVPVVGAVMLVLFADKATLAAKLLSTKAFVGIGLISYSAYLWHQPLFSFARILFYEPSVFVLSFFSVISMALAYLSWRYIEKPFRSKEGPFSSQKIIFGAFFTIILLYSSIGILGHISSGFKDTTENRRDLAALGKKIEPNYGLHSDCEGEYTLSDRCRTSEAPIVLLWGDSFAMHLYQGIQASNSKVELRQHTKVGCSPILGIHRVSNKIPQHLGPRCINFNNSVFEWLVDANSVEFVVLSSPFKWVEKDDFTDMNGAITSATVEEVLPRLISTIEAIKSLGKGVILVSPTPLSGTNIGQCLVRKEQFLTSDNCDFPLESSDGATKLLKRLSETHSVYWLHNDICPGRQCFASQNNIFIYRDGLHLSKEGSAYLGQINNWYKSFRRQAFVQFN